MEDQESVRYLALHELVDLLCFKMLQSLSTCFEIFRHILVCFAKFLFSESSSLFDCADSSHAVHESPQFCSLDPFAHFLPLASLHRATAHPGSPMAIPDLTDLGCSSPLRNILSQETGLQVTGESRGTPSEIPNGDPEWRSRISQTGLPHTSSRRLLQARGKSYKCNYARRGAVRDRE
jgi:hypothetical protein